jgi:hypothetical protein
MNACHPCGTRPPLWYMPGERTSVYLAADRAAAVKASGRPLAELVRRGVAASTAPATQAPAPVASPAGPLVLPPGEPCPGVACAGPGCWNRDTARYGLRRLVLCTACAAALQGKDCKREVPENAARAIRRGVA